MQAISLWEPWGSAVRTKAKTYETRHWATKYRGPLAIHCAKRCIKKELAEFLDDPRWQRALAPLVDMDIEPWRNWQGVCVEHLTFGAIVATVDLVDCIPTADVSEFVIETQGFLGDYGPDRFAWEFQDIRPLAEPIPWRGAQNFFSVTI